MDALTHETKAWRVTFAQTISLSEFPNLAVVEPAGARVAMTPIEVEEALASSDEAPSDAIDLIWLPPSAGAGGEIEKRLEREAGPDDIPRRPPIRASLRSTRVLWTPHLAVIATAPDQLSDAIDAVVRFTQAERWMVELEQEMAAVWPQVDAHKNLIHSVTRRQLKQQRAVDALTERAAHMGVRLLGLTAAIEQLDPRLASGSKRLYAELVLQAGIYDRLEVLDDPVSFANDQFERANTRLIETRNALVGFYLETLIVVVLLAEIAIFAWAKI